MKTKYIKFAVEDRMPEKDKELFIINSENEIFHGYLSSRNNWIIYGLKNAGNIQYFLEEVPDREESNIKSAIAFGYNTGFYNGRNNENYLRPDIGKEYDEFIQELEKI